MIMYCLDENKDNFIVFTTEGEIVYIGTLPNYEYLQFYDFQQLLCLKTNYKYAKYLMKEEVTHIEWEH